VPSSTLSQAKANNIQRSRSGNIFKTAILIISFFIQAPGCTSGRLSRVVFVLPAMKYQDYFIVDSVIQM
jgi:hypothetical protein